VNCVSLILWISYRKCTEWTLQNSRSYRLGFETGTLRTRNRHSSRSSASYGRKYRNKWIGPLSFICLTVGETFSHFTDNSHIYEFCVSLRVFLVCTAESVFMGFSLVILSRWFIHVYVRLSSILFCTYYV